MSYSNPGGSSGGAAPQADINVTPLVDVMLVLVVIFLITAPMLTHKIRIDLPQPNQDVKPPENPPEPIKLAIKANGTVFMNDQMLPIPEVNRQLQVIEQMHPNKKQQPEVQIKANDNVQYEIVAKVLAAVKSSGMEKIGFVSTD